MAGANQVIANLNKWADHQATAVVALAEDWAGTLEAKMKAEQMQDRYWKNRTYHAVQGLFGRVEIRGKTVLIQLAHSMEYGIYLELARNGKHAILKPTLDAAIPEIYRTYKELWRR